MPSRPPLIVPEIAQSSDNINAPMTDRPQTWSSRLFSRPGLLILFPGLMLVAGAILVWMGQLNLRESVETALHQRVMDQTAIVSQATITCLGQAQPLLEQVRGQVMMPGGIDSNSFALFARTLMSQRQGVTYIAYSGVDGSFRGVFTDREKDQAPRFNHSWIMADGTTSRRISDFAPDGALVTAKTQSDTGYDPRKRPFYAPAVEAAGPVWTKPYQFFTGDETGITCAVAVRDPASGALLGVASVDFGLTALSAVLAQAVQETPSSEIAFLFTRTGTRIASSGDLNDPAQRAERVKVVEALAARLPAAGETRFSDLTGDGLPILVGVRGVQVPDGPLWYVGIRAPRDALVAEAKVALNRTLAVGAVGITVAVAMAALLANYVARQQRIVNDAKAAVAAANDRLRSMGSYTLVRQLGAGGMGTVWLAEHRMLVRPAALKLIHPQVLGRTPEEQQVMRARFEREAKATASLRSRNTVTLYDYGVADNGSFYYAMELLDGLDLHQLVTEYGPQKASRVIHIVMQACASLGEAHRNGMVHRDIKPANIYLCRQGLDVDVVKVLDFGLVSEQAQKDKHLTAAGVVHGTPAFMAPEQARGNKVLDGRTDLYALGCVAYWLLSGRLVFEQGTAMAMMAAHADTPPPPIGVIAGQYVPKGLSDLIMRLLAKKPADRPADAIEVINLLRALPSEPEQQWTPAQAEQWWTLHRTAATKVSAPAQASTDYQPHTGPL